MIAGNIFISYRLNGAIPITTTIRGLLDRLESNCEGVAIESLNENSKPCYLSLKKVTRHKKKIYKIVFNKQGICTFYFSEGVIFKKDNKEIPIEELKQGSLVDGYRNVYEVLSCQEYKNDYTYDLKVEGSGWFLADNILIKGN